MLKRLSWLPDRDALDNGSVIAGQEYNDVEFLGGSAANLILTDCTINGITTTPTLRVVTTAGSVTPASDDYTIIINKASPATTSVLLSGAETNGRRLEIKDGAGNASTYPITLTGTVDGATNPTISDNYGGVIIEYNGTDSQWNIIADVSTTGGLPVVPIAKNLVLAGPVTGANATPTFRLFNFADLPNSVTRFGTNVGTGSDDTAAFAAALAAYQNVFIPPGTYIVGDLALPSGSCLYAFCPTNYAIEQSDTVVQAKNGATAVFTMAATNTVRLSGFDIDGIDRTPNALTSVIGAGGFVTMENMGIRNCNYGLGDGAYFQGVLATSCSFFGNNYGVTNVVDATFNGCNFSANLNDGIALLSGANNNTFNGCRIEFNQGNGILIYSAANIQFNGGTFDRNYKNGIWLGDDGGSQTPSQIIINGVLLQRNGRNNIAGEQSHIYFNGGSRGTATIISNCTTHTGKDDDGSGTLSPALSIDIESAALGSVIIADNELTGNTTGGIGGAINNATLLTNGVIRNNVGYPDFTIGQSPFNQDSTGIYYTKGFVSIATSASGTINVAVPAVNTFGSAQYEMQILVRNAGTGERYSGFYNLVCQREGSGASYIVSDLIGEIGTAGTIQFGAGAINLSIGTVATDGSTFVLTAANTTGGTIGFNVWVRA